MIKQVIVIRKDLKMRRGKEIAQGAHASMAWLTNKLRRHFDTNDGGWVAGDSKEDSWFEGYLTTAEREWVEGSFTKVCVRVNSEEELRAIYEAALKAGLKSHLIVDAGKTEFGGVPTPTCVGIGPDLAEKIDAVTGHLELY